MCVQALVPKAIVERFHERVVSGFARPAEVQRYAVLIGSAVECFRDELRPIVHTNGLRPAADRRDPPHRFDRLLALDPLVDVDRQSFAGEGTDHISFAASAAGCRSQLAALTLRRGFLSRRLSPSSR